MSQKSIGLKGSIDNHNEAFAVYGMNEKVKKKVHFPSVEDRVKNQTYPSEDPYALKMMGSIEYNGKTPPGLAGSDSLNSLMDEFSGKKHKELET